MMRTPTDYPIGAARGFHYCKLLSPFRALEWIYIDSLYDRDGIKSDLDHSQPVCKKLENLGFISARDTERMSVATHAQKHRHRNAGNRPPVGPHDIITPTAEVPQALVKLSNQMMHNPSVAGHLGKGETMQILIDDVPQVGDTKVPSHRIRVVKQHQTWVHQHH